MIFFMNIRHFTIKPFGNIAYAHKSTIYLYFFKIDQFFTLPDISVMVIFLYNFF